MNEYRMKSIFDILTELEKKSIDKEESDAIQKFKFILLAENTRCTRRLGYMDSDTLLFMILILTRSIRPEDMNKVFYKIINEVGKNKINIKIIKTKIAIRSNKHGIQ